MTKNARLSAPQFTLAAVCLLLCSSHLPEASQVFDDGVLLWRLIRSYTFSSRSSVSPPPSLCVIILIIIIRLLVSSDDDSQFALTLTRPVCLVLLLRRYSSNSSSYLIFLLVLYLSGWPSSVARSSTSTARNTIKRLATTSGIINTESGR